MRRIFYFLLLLFFSSTVFAQLNQNGKIAIAIHGGAGTIKREDMSPEREAEYRAKLEEALKAGHQVLENGGSSLNAVVAAIQIMEESPLFNAGKGAVFTNEVKNELDAAIMDGKTRNAGTVAGISTVKSPVAAARVVMENSPHVMMIGQGAEQFAEEQGLEMVDPSYFFTDRRYEQLQRIKDTEQQQLEHDGDKDSGDRRPGDQREGMLDEKFPDRKFGTVGAVALDQEGNLAAATSTGGMTNKRYGRVGDVPIIGAGTYADNTTCAVSATGHGEYFIRSVVAYDIAALMKYKGLSLKEAGEEVVKDKLVKMGGGGGVISIDAQGNIAMPFNTAGMYRASISPGGEMYIGIYEDE
ncbi:isoaspartyl peptidase/L-asparaginase family protein [Catalinimonas niigatensis]|uniref:isoaspartyl peptidase/L-asparaginase family protein n=1 Tax=Catalinimonas niigatensis TaxID=1397264 RepID=UPI00266719E9|nr:isoaspartyl peptidase/L-asparaginase [Catalinimonas niigatensis]WPP48042.1 isoaspartyl peptidase/L-asparaginase [Catalinimonas niigatensis]